MRKNWLFSERVSGARTKNTSSQAYVALTALMLLALLLTYLGGFRSSLDHRMVKDIVDIVEGMSQSPHGDNLRDDIPHDDSTGLLSKLSFPIILEVGQTRSGSTFQTHLLGAILGLKTGKPAQLTYLPLNHGNLRHLSTIIAKHDKSVPLVIKTHKDMLAWEEFQKNGTLAVFSSETRKTPYALYTQRKEDLLNCSLCEVDKYKDIFGLTPEEIQLVKDYMSHYEILRRCCDSQMSKFERWRLNGCNVDQYKSLPEYPHCEAHDLDEIERRFDALPIPHVFRVDGHKYQGQIGGNCSAIRSIISHGRGMNGQDFEGCGLLANSKRRAR